MKHVSSARVTMNTVYTVHDHLHSVTLLYYICSRTCSVCEHQHSKYTQTSTRTHVFAYVVHEHAQHHVQEHVHEHQH